MLSHPGNLSVDMHVCRRHTSYSRLLILPLLFQESSVVVRLRVGVLLVVTACVAVTFPVVEASAADPLHVQVDRLVTESPLGLVSGASTDGEFLRRLYLAVLGRIPSVEETRAFLADKSPTKRPAAVDSLLGTPAYVRRMTNVMDVMLSERRGDGEVPVSTHRHRLADGIVPVRSTEYSYRYVEIWPQHEQATSVRSRRR